MKKIFTLAAAAFMAFAAQANVLTVCDGTAVNYMLPINGWYVDELGTMGQMIYPAEMLAEMENGKISQVKFFAEEAVEFEACELTLSLKTVDQNGFETATAITGATAVSTMDAVYGTRELVFDLYEPYEYTGGNLLVEVAVSYEGDYNWVSTYFLGVETEYYASFSHYNSYGSPSDKLHQFLPKCAFTYEPGEVTPPTPPTPTEMTAAPTFNGYTEDGIHAYFVEINQTEPSTIYYRVQSPDGEWTEWAEYTEVLAFTGNGKYRVEAYAVAPNKAASYEIAYEFVVSPFTGIEEMNADKAVANVRYFNMAGQEMQQANGLTIMVTTYTDGTTSSKKVMK